MASSPAPDAPLKSRDDFLVHEVVCEDNGWSENRQAKHQRPARAKGRQRKPRLSFRTEENVL